MYVDRGRHAQAGAVQHGRPEQGVEIHDVLADEMHHLGTGFRGVLALDEIREADRPVRMLRIVRIAILAERGQIADWRVNPDVEIFAGFAGNFETEIRRVARDVPTAQAVGEPFLQLVDDLALQAAGATTLGQPILQHCLEVGELDEKMQRFLLDRRCA